MFILYSYVFVVKANSSYSHASMIEKPSRQPLHWRSCSVLLKIIFLLLLNMEESFLQHWRHWGLRLRRTHLYSAQKQNRLCLQYSAADLVCGVTLANKLLHLISSYHHYGVNFSLLKLQLQWGTLNINVAIVSNSFICNIFIYIWRVTATIH